MTHFFSDYAGDLKREFGGYNLDKFRKDLLAGVTVAAIALPLALAFGAGSGADAAAGLITAIISAIIVGALSGTSFQISGPTGAMAAILIPLVAKYGLKGLFAATAMAGIILIVAGIAHIGKLVNLLPAPIISGFTSGIAVIIALGQIDNLLGVTSEGDDVVECILYLCKELPPVNFYSVGLGVFVIAFMLVWPKKWNMRVPASLLGVIAATVAASLLSFDVATVGSVPRTIIHDVRMSFSDLTDIPYDAFILPAISIAALCMIESLLCGASAGRMKQETMNADRELISQGIGNLILPFFGGVPTTAAIARTSVAIKSGSQTRLTGIIQGFVLLLSMFLLNSFMSKIPLAALAGVLIVTAWRMNEWHSIKYMTRHRLKSAMTKFFITMLTTVLFDLTIAIAVGLFFSIILFVIQSSELDVQINDFDPERLDNAVEIDKHVQVIYITGSIFFGSLGPFQTKLANASGRVLIFSMRGVPFIDDSALAALHDFCNAKKSEGITVLFACVQPRIKTLFNRAGITAIVGEQVFFDNAKDAIFSLSCSPEA